MGGTTWTDARDSRLFILVLDRANINGEGFAALAAAYKKEYQDTGIDDYAPTAKAIKEHIDKLKKKTSGIGGTPKSTPRKVAVAKTPTSSKTLTTARKSVNNTNNATPSRSAKRKRTTKSSSDEMSDVLEEDTNDERNILTASKASVAPRSSLSCRSKSLAKSYQQPSEDDEDEDADAEASAEEVDVNTTIVTSTAVNGTTNAVAEGVEEMDLDTIAVSAVPAGNTNGHPTPQGKTANGEKGGSGKKRAFKRDVGDESDGSDFVPSFFN